MRAIPEGCAATPRWYSLCSFSRFVDQEKATFSVNSDGTHNAGPHGWAAKAAGRLARIFGLCAAPDNQRPAASPQMVEANCAEGPASCAESFAENLWKRSDCESEVDVEVSRHAARAAEQAALRDALERVLDKLSEGERARRAAVRRRDSGALA